MKNIFNLYKNLYFNGVNSAFFIFYIFTHIHTFTNIHFLKSIHTNKQNINKNINKISMEYYIFFNKN